MLSNSVRNCLETQGSTPYARIYHAFSATPTEEGSCGRARPWRCLGEKLADARNIIMVVKTGLRQKTYDIVSKRSKRKDTARRQEVRKPLRLYEGGCHIDFDAVDATFRQRH